MSLLSSIDFLAANILSFAYSVILRPKHCYESSIKVSCSSKLCMTLYIRSSSLIAKKNVV